MNFDNITCWPQSYSLSTPIFTSSIHEEVYSHSGIYEMLEEENLDPRPRYRLHLSLPSVGISTISKPN